VLKYLLLVILKKGSEVMKNKIKIYETLKNVFKKSRNTKESNIDYENAKTILKNDKNAILVDVRSPQEYKEEHIEGSINFPLYDLERDCGNLSKESTIILYCQSGNRSKRALKILEEQGYRNVYQIEGGLDNL